MSKTVVGLFNSTAEAQQVKQSLVASGYSASDIRIVANDHEDDLASSSSMDVTSPRSRGFGQDGEDIGTDAGMQSTTGTLHGSSYTGSESGSTTGESFGQKISSFFHSLTGGDEEAHGHYTSGVHEGGAVLTVTAQDEDANAIASLLRQHGARDIEGGGSQRQTGTERLAGTESLAADQGGRSYAAGEVSGQKVIPVIEEQIEVGKREVDRGGVRVYSHVVERPSEAEVTLRDERVNVERRAADRPATEADFQAGRGGSFEVRAAGEEAVVEKTSRVVEEVVVGKQASERTEAVHDSVRRTEVEVEQISGSDRTEAERAGSERS